MIILNIYKINKIYNQRFYKKNVTLNEESQWKNCQLKIKILKSVLKKDVVCGCVT